MPTDFKLPDLGEGLSEAVLVDWKVKEGDVVQPDQVLAEVETDKATSSLPAPFAGKIVKLHGKPGDTLKVGAPVVSFEPAEGAPPRASEQVAAPKPMAAPRPTAPPPPSRMPERQTIAQPALRPAASARSDSGDGARRPVLAAPATRRLAREKGIDIRLVHGTGPGGRVTPEDVLAYVSSPDRRRGADGVDAEPGEHAGVSESPATFPRPMLPDFTQWGQVERQKATAIRKRIAQRMVLSVQTTASVTHIDEADITALEESRQQAQKRAEELGIKLTLLPFVIRAVVAALQRYPIFNASYDDDKQEIVLKKYYHIGIAVDSPQGLLVPVIRDADKKTVLQLAQDLVQLSGKARDGKLTADEMRGGSFTITNIGAIGGTAFTPIINWPEVAILGLARTQDRPAVQSNALVNRKKLPLILTFDHRVTDGAQGARFVNEVKQYLENPLLLLLEN
jgi:pyruvate dehydrogenase E2 component (dihydrolipoyllysine-residue acetyltransferase)